MSEWVGNITVGYLLFIVIVGQIIGQTVCAIIKHVACAFDNVMRDESEPRDSYRR